MEKKCEFVKNGEENCSKKEYKKIEFVGFYFYFLCFFIDVDTYVLPPAFCVYSTKKLCDRVIHAHRIEKVKYKRRKID